MQAHIGPVYTTTGYRLPNFELCFNGPANFIGLTELQTQSLRPYCVLGDPPTLLRDLDQSDGSQLSGRAIGSIPVFFELQSGIVEAEVYVLPQSMRPVVGTETIYKIAQCTLNASAATSTAPQHSDATQDETPNSE